jgi:hypothetical protein
MRLTNIHLLRRHYAFQIGCLCQAFTKPAIGLEVESRMLEVESIMVEVESKMLSVTDPVYALK